MLKRFAAVLLALCMCVLPSYATTVKISYGSTTSLTVTGLQSLVNGGNTYWSSAVVSNTSTLAIDYLVRVTIATGSSGVLPTGTILVYMADCPGGATPCTDGAGTQGTFTPTSLAGGAAAPNMKFLGSCNVSAVSTTYNICFSSDLAGAPQLNGTMPDGFAIAVYNLSAATLGSSGNAVSITPINLTNQ